MCDELRERNPGIFDNYIKQHNVPDLAEIHNSKERQKLYTDIKATIDFAVPTDSARISPVEL